MSKVTPSTAFTTRLTESPPVSLSQALPPPRSKWTLRSRMAIRGTPRPLSIGGGMRLTALKSVSWGFISANDVAIPSGLTDSAVICFHVPGAILRTLRWQNDKANNAPAAVEQTAEILGDRCPRRVRSGAQMDNQPLDVRRQAVNQESGRAFLVHMY